MKFRVAVRDLAEHVHRSGDIHYRFDQPTTSAEGIEAQRRYQIDSVKTNANYLTEQGVTEAFSDEDLELAISGRIDGVLFRGERGDRNRCALVEEIKTTRSEFEQLYAYAGGLHFAQLKIYAAMLCKRESLSSCELRLTYLHPDRNEQIKFEDFATSQQLRRYFVETCRTYVNWLLLIQRLRGRRTNFLRTMDFPYTEFRDDQRNIARSCYRTFRDSGQLLVEAPTGTGKTMATLFPAAKAMGEGILERVIYATARNTGQRAAEQALKKIAASDSQLTAITLTAKEKICFNPDVPCDPDVCDYARSYYERLPNARKDLMANGINDRGAVERIARMHEVCPFELASDVSRWVDVVVCDYNHVFDPIFSRVRQLGNETAHAGLLIDEAHQLGNRVQEMLSTRIDRSQLKRLEASSPSDGVAKKIRSIDRALANLGRTYLPEGGELVLPEPPRALIRALDRFLRVVFDDGPERTFDEYLKEFVFTAHRLHKGSFWYDDEAFRYFLTREGSLITVQMRCLKPGSYIREVVDDFRGSVRFSGTLSPATVFQTMHGCEGPALRSTPSYGAHNTGVYVVPDVSTFFRDRATTAPMVANVIRSVVNASPGNYLVAFPSFEYLRLIQDFCCFDAELLSQERSMSLDDQGEFIEWINTPHSMRVGFVVLGGVFTESVDYRSGVLRGAVVVGPGIPPRSLVRDTLAENDGSNEIAYRQPGMTRVVQAAGRVARGPMDRGVVVMIDPRFAESAYQKYFPHHWRPHPVIGSAIGSALANFWSS